MTFKEFSIKVKADTRLTDLINRYSDPASPDLTDAEMDEMLARADRIHEESEE